MSKSKPAHNVPGNLTLQAAKKANRRFAAACNVGEGGVGMERSGMPSEPVLKIV